MENQNIILTKELHESFSNGNYERCLELAHDDVQVFSYAMGVTFNGKGEFENFFLGFKQAFPDLRIEYKNIFADDNNVAAEFKLTGTHSGPLHTLAGVIQPSGKKVTVNIAEFLEWEEGKLRKLINYQDSLALLKQIGAL